MAPSRSRPWHLHLLSAAACLLLSSSAASLADASASYGRLGLRRPYTDASNDDVTSGQEASGSVHTRSADIPLRKSSFGGEIPGQPDQADATWQGATWRGAGREGRSSFPSRSLIELKEVKANGAGSVQGVSPKKAPPPPPPLKGVAVNRAGSVQGASAKKGPPPRPSPPPPPPPLTYEETGGANPKVELEAKKKGVPPGCSLLVGGPNGLKGIQEAIDSIGKNSAAQQKVVCVLPGVYRERVTIQIGQDGITIRGSGMNATRIVAGKSKTSASVNPFSVATLTVQGSYFRGENFTAENTSKNLTTPSPAVSLLGNYSSWEKVAFEAWDDTLGLGTSRHIFKDCLVTGLVDIIWGFGRAAFQSTRIYIRYYQDPKVVYTGHIATLGTGVNSFGDMAGATFYGCTVYGPGLTALGQAYRPQVMVTYINCNLGSNVVKQGWDDLFNRFSPAQSIFLEYGSTGPGAQLRGRKYGKAFKGPAPASLQQRNYIGTDFVDQVQKLSKVFNSSLPFFP